MEVSCLGPTGAEMTTHFINVDLDVRSRSPLEPLASAFGQAVCVLHVGREGKLHGAHFEVADSHDKDADAILREFVALIRKLPPRARKLWKDARSRDFNIGIQSAAAPLFHELHLGAKTLQAVARVGGAIVITTYAPVVEAARSTSRRSEASRRRR